MYSLGGLIQFVTDKKHLDPIWNTVHRATWGPTLREMKNNFPLNRRHNFRLGHHLRDEIWEQQDDPPQP